MQKIDIPRPDSSEEFPEWFDTFAQTTSHFFAGTLLPGLMSYRIT